MNVDVEKIMKEIRSNIKMRNGLNIPQFGCDEKGQTNSSRNKSDNMKQLENDVNYLQNQAMIPYYWRFKPGIRGFAKRIVRRLIKCVVFYVVDNQNIYNSHVAETADIIQIILKEQQDEIRKLKEELSRLKQ